MASRTEGIMGCEAGWARCWWADEGSFIQRWSDIDARSDASFWLTVIGVRLQSASHVAIEHYLLHVYRHGVSLLAQLTTFLTRTW
jgi:hypothetical protein